MERAIAAVNARDIEAYLACCTEDIELRTPLAPVSGVYGGPPVSGGSSRMWRTRVPTSTSTSSAFAPSAPIRSSRS